ncbi:5013_t:CDS:1, partial [Entrophospora sp. SA101]
LLERLQAHEYCVRVLSPNLVICIRGSKIQLDRPYVERFFERHLNNSGCKRNTQ